jgi:hypothetical protein
VFLQELALGVTADLDVFGHIGLVGAGLLECQDMHELELDRQVIGPLRPLLMFGYIGTAVGVGLG